MNKFETIDHKLYDFAIKRNGILSKDRPFFPKNLIHFEERRIDWTENEIRKAIIIQPTFTQAGVNLSLWNFINIAWTLRNGIAVKPGWHQYLIEKKDFSEIEDEIEQLLITSEQNLIAITIKDVI